MSTQLFLVPQVFNSDGFLAPEYWDTDLVGTTYVMMPFGLELCGILATDANSALAAESDVYAFPSDLTSVLADTDVDALNGWLSNYSIPSSQIVSGLSFAEAARSLAQIAQVLQRNLGLTGNAVFSGQTFASIQTQSAAIIAGTQSPGPPTLVAQLNVGTVGQHVAQPSLAASISDFSTLNTSLTSVASSFGFDAPDTSSDIETAIASIAQQWTAPLVLDHTGSGFAI
jgi:hypothetical protein